MRFFGAEGVWWSWDGNELRRSRMSEFASVSVRELAARHQVVASQGSLARLADYLVPNRNILALGILLALLQALDGVLTSLGVNRYGVTIEGNPLMRDMMAEFGHVPALTLVKAGAIMVVMSLTLIAHKLPWVKNAMGAVTCIYLFAAILPWTYILFFKTL